jgi:hypothetical protein
MEILIGGCCSLWEQRNDAIFNTDMDPAKVFPSLTMHKAMLSLREGMQAWLDAILDCS